MGWMDYYQLIEKYGSVAGAPDRERAAAFRANPNTPGEAIRRAEHVWAAMRRARAEGGVAPDGVTYTLYSLDSEIVAVHLLTGGECGDESCACWKRGFQSGLEMARERKGP